jgi:hypothetical protein
LIDSLEQLADVIRRRIAALAAVGSLGFILGLVLLDTRWSAFGYVGMLAAIWCFGLYVFVELLTPNEPTSDSHGQRLMSPMRMASSRFEYLIGLGFVVGWFVALGALTLVFVRHAWW